MNITVIGTGYVGLVTGTCFADFGLNVVCVDKDASKIERLKKGELTIYEPGLKELVDKNVREKRLSFTTEVAASVRNSLVVFIAVGTPPRGDGSTDLKYVEAVAAEIADNLNGYKVIVTKSTVPVGTGAIVERIINEKKKGEHLFDVASNPEFLREGSAVEDFMRPDRVVVGARSAQAIAILKDMYTPLYLIETPFVITSIETAELIKYASNAFLATKISFINEVANICERVGADVHVVAKAMGLDKRIGGKFLHPGPGFGGSCFPKDTTAIWNIAKNAGYDFKLVDAVIRANKDQRAVMVEKVRKAAGGSLKGVSIAMLGLTFKPNTDDIRESPAIDVAEALIKEGAALTVFDPVGMDNAKEVLPKSVRYAADAYDAAKGAECLVIATEWNQFRKLDLDRIKGDMKKPVVVDMRNVYEPEVMRKAGFTHYAVGRS